MRLLSAGSDGLLVEVADLDQALALFGSLQEDPPSGVVELVPAARTVLVRFDPDRTGPAALAEALARRPLIAAATADGALVEIAVHYDGADLAEVARLCGLTEAEVVRRHTASPWTVAFTGFAPGFAYLSGGDPALDVPRRAEPRTVIPAGSVGLAGPFSGIYPRASPGGWQLLGRTSAALWDLGRPDPALLRPGMRVRFVDAGPAPTPEPATPEAAIPHPALPQPVTPDPATPDPGARNPGAHEPASGGRADRSLEILSPGPLTVVADLGRPGRAAQGVARSGAVDRGALRRANRLVGNPVDTPALEVATGGIRVRAHGDLVIAVAGAPAPLLRLDAQPAPAVPTEKVSDVPTEKAFAVPTEKAFAVPTEKAFAVPTEKAFAVPTEKAFALDDGEELQLGTPPRGVLSYLAVRGGLVVEPVLGSASTDLLAGIGPDPLRAGDVVAVGSAATTAVTVDQGPGPDLPAPDEVVEVDVVTGPREHWFTAAARERFLAQEWTVTPRSNRVGLRLQGPQALDRARTGELPSEGTVPGAVQIPPNGQPVVFTADHPVTGGYPVIACVAAHHLDRVGQVPVGGRIQFRAVPDDRPATPPKGRP